MQSAFYAEREYDELDFAGNYYSRHIQAMTAEGLNAKHQIAGELAYRDMIIDQLKRDMANLQAQFEEACLHCEELQDRLDKQGV